MRKTWKIVVLDLLIAASFVFAGATLTYSVEFYHYIVPGVLILLGYVMIDVRVQEGFNGQNR